MLLVCPSVMVVQCLCLYDFDVAVHTKMTSSSALQNHVNSLLKGSWIGVKQAHINVPDNRPHNVNFTS